MSEKWTIREAVVEDIAQVDPIRRAVFPWHSASLATQENWFRTNPPQAKPLRLAAFVDRAGDGTGGGRLVGFGSASLNIVAAEPGQGFVYLLVDPGFRGQGVGKALFDRLEQHLRDIGVRRAQAHALDDPSVLAWAQRQGFEIGANERWSMVDPRELPPMPPVPAGVEVVSLGELGPEAAYGVDTQAFLDEPGDVPNGIMSYEQFMNQIWNSPDLDHEVSIAAIVDGVPAATTNLEVNPATGRAMSAGTSTLREFRGRGLAKLIKSVSLRRAAEKGVTAAFTANDYSNAPMIAINDWLGYKVIGGSRSVLKKL
jgi:GNAT superfamily N-acetyltransferase